MEANAIESALILRGQDVPALKAKMLAYFRTDSHSLPAKVFPLLRHEDWMRYPDAETGIPQFRLLREVRWVVRQVVQARAPLGGQHSS